MESIAHYRIGPKLGEGGMGAVYRATDTKLNRDVAIKVLPEAFAQDAARMQRFEREAQALAALNHPNIAAIYGVEQGAIVMELVEGEDLRGPVPLATALDYARQIAAGLEAAHEKGIVHRDLKPANLKVTHDGVVKLLDFGLAKAVDGSQAEASITPSSATMSPTLSLGMTQAGVILGTAAYMSPEQARGKPVDKRADIWAFGVVLYEMLTGSMLFGGGETVSDSLAAVITREPDWSALPKDTPPRIRGLLERCLRKDPRQRLRDIGDARLTIDETDPVTPVSVGPPAQERRWWLPWAVAGVFAAAAALGAGNIWLRPKPVELAAARFPLPLPEGTRESASPAAAQAVPSPDGRSIAFVAIDQGSGKESLWVRPLGSLGAHKLDKTEGANFPFWSPDGQFLAFFADDKLKRIAVAGGPAQTLCEAKKAAGGRVSGDGGTWNRDGVIVFAPIGTPLMRVSASGGMATAVTHLEPEEQSHSWPQFLPDGRTLLYFAKGKDPDHSGIYVQELGSSRRTLVLKTRVRAAWSPPGYLLFVRENTLFAQRMNARTHQLEGEATPVAEDVSANEATNRAAFAVSDNGVLVYRGAVVSRMKHIVWLDRDGKRLGTVGKAGMYETIALSPDEKSVAIAVRTESRFADTWVMDLSSGVLTRMTMDAQSSLRMGPWSPDSRRLAVNRVTGGVSELTVASGKTRVLTEDTLYADDWSHDGASLLCTDHDSHRLIVLPLTRDTSQRSILDTAYGKIGFRFSPDGRSVAYQSTESGGSEIFVAAFPSFADKRQVSSGGGFVPSWRRDGKEIFFVTADGKVMGAEIKAGSRIEAGVPKQLFQLPRTVGRFISVANAGDGRRFLTLESEQPAEEPHQLVVVNWAADLK